MALEPKSLMDIVNLFTDIGVALIPLLAAVAFFAFIWGVAKFIKASGSGQDVKESKNMIIWGVIGMFVLVAVWGIIAFVRSELGFGGGTPLIPLIHI